jgi:ABC-type lipoprotein release transport system permease subunit
MASLTLCSLVFFAVAGLASALPATRAAQIAPAEALKID